MQNLCVIIPARYKSKRLPGKPLIKILNKELLLLTYEKVKKIYMFLLSQTKLKKH